MRSCSSSARTCGEGIKSPKPRQSRRSFRCINRGERLFRPCAHRNILRQIHPANRAAWVEVKLRRPRDIRIFRSGAAMKNIVATNYLSILIRQKRKRVSHFSTVGASYVNRIDTDRGEMDATSVEIRKTLLKTPQLGVAKRSPISAIENQDRAIGRKQISQRNLFSVLIWQRKIRRFSSNPRRLSRKWNLLQHIKDLVAEECKEREAENGEDRAENSTAIKLRAAKRAEQANQK